MTVILISKDISTRFGPARDQGDRPTCLAFAVSDTHAALRDPWNELSAEYIFYYTQKNANLPLTAGAMLLDMLIALETNGQPHEHRWTYSKTLPADLSRWAPPIGVLVFRRISEVVSTTVDKIIECLDTGSPVVLLINLSPDFFNVQGEMIDLSHISPPDPNRRHAVVAVAHGKASGQRIIRIRNSWGDTWGNEGYVWLTENFLVSSLFGIALLKEDPDVSPGFAAA
mgnify:CR=1 FL=1